MAVMDDATSRHAAHEDLQYIRRTLAAAGHISTVPGRGLVTIGGLALAVALADRVWFHGLFWTPSWFPTEGWVAPSGSGGISASAGAATLAMWMLLLVVSLIVGAGSMRAKARRTGQMFFSPVLRKAMWGYGSAMLLGAVLTVAAMRIGRADLLPEAWLGCYGVALVSAGGYSVSPVRWMGFCFLALAAVAATTPPVHGLALLALGFGWVHIAFGAYIAWRHDG